MNETLSPLREEWITVNEQPTYVLKIGKIQKDVPLMLILPGNPGVANFYEEFMLKLHEKSGCVIPVWCVSHVGQVTLPQEHKSHVSANDSIDIDGQLKHKSQFVQNCVPKNIKLILIGHSIGAYMLLQVIKDIPENRFIKGFLLFPTIERMALSPKGSVLKPIMTYLRWLLLLVSYQVYYFIPQGLQKLITEWYMYLRGHTVDNFTIRGVLKLIDPACVHSVFHLGKTELEKVVEPCHDILKLHINKLMFYYGQDDPWCPVEYYHDMKKVYPEADIHLCSKNLAHAFVLEHSTPMVEFMWEWIQKNMPSLHCIPINEN